LRGVLVCIIDKTNYTALIIQSLIHFFHKAINLILNNFQQAGFLGLWDVHLLIYILFIYVRIVTANYVQIVI